jgi:hypothetical protein
MGIHNMDRTSLGKELVFVCIIILKDWRKKISVLVINNNVGKLRYDFSITT